MSGNVEEELSSLLREEVVSDHRGAGGNTEGMGTGDKKDKKQDRNNKVALPICTRDSINHTLECITCKEKGIRGMYWGESSRSAGQRGLEHHR